jgi:hypothetical protein
MRVSPCFLRAGVALASAALSGATACEAFMPLDGFEGSGDASTEDRDSSPDGPPVDVSGADGPNGDAPDGGGSGGDAYTGCVIDTTDAASWDVMGTATVESTFFQLTPDLPDSGGGIFWPAQTPLTAFDLSFDFSITYSGSQASDGLAFVAFEGSPPTTCFQGGSALCLARPPGFGVAVRTLMCSSPGPPNIAVIDTSYHCTDDGGSPLDLVTIADPYTVEEKVDSGDDGGPPSSSWHTIAVHVVQDDASAPLASVSLDDASVITAVQVPRVDYGYWGFVAATGYNSERTAVRNVRMSMEHCP